jgi:hypothetical protein
MTDRFRVGLSPDFLDESGRNVWGDIGLGALDAAGLPWAHLSARPDQNGEMLAAAIAGCAAALFAAPAVTERTFSEHAEPPRRRRAPSRSVAVAQNPLPSAP